MANFIRAAFPIWQFIDPTTGLPLNDEYWVSFLSNVFPYLPQFVYRDNQGLVPWSDPIQLNSGGQLADNLYFQDDLVYRIEVRHGPTQNDQLINEINDFIPNGGNINPDSGSAGLENQITNPQFAFINFVSPLSITTAGTYSIGPDWDLVLTGTGTVTVTQLIATAEQDKPGTNIPPYALRFAVSSGWTSAILQQRFDGLGGIFNNSFISMSVLARSEVGNNNLILKYAPNPPGTPIVIADSPLGLGVGYTPVQGVQPLPVSTNTTQSNLAYIDMQIVLPVNGTTDISDVSVAEQSSLINVPFALLPDETLERQQDHLFHYYSDQLINNPKNSILVGWNFSVNPFQFNPIALTTAATQTMYVADQTIIRQEAVSRVQTGQGSALQRFALVVKAINGAADNRIALIQYVDSISISPYWNYVVSSLVQAGIFSAVNSNVRIKMRLIWRRPAPPVISPTEPILSWAPYDVANPPDPVFSAGWTEIKPINDPAYTLAQASLTTGTEYPGVAFNGFQLPNDIGAGQTLGIVLYTIDPMDTTLAAEDSIVFDKISLVPNDFAVQTHPQTADQCLRECQYYYETNVDLRANIEVGSTNGSEVGILQPAITGASFNAFSRFLSVSYNTRKRVIVNPKIYATNGVLNSVLILVYQGPLPPKITVNCPIAGNWTLADLGETGFNLQPVDRGVQLTAGVAGAPGLPGAEAIALFNWVADARLGL